MDEGAVSGAETYTLVCEFLVPRHGCGCMSLQEPHEEPPLLHPYLSLLELCEKVLDRLFYRLVDSNGFPRCVFGHLLSRLAGFHLEHRVLQRHLLSEQEIT